jgi:hypothetical protein
MSDQSKPKPNVYNIVGEISIATTGYAMKIIAARTLNDIDVRFNDGIVVKGTTYEKFKDGKVQHKASSSPKVNPLKAKIEKAKKNNESLLEKEKKHFTEATYTVLTNAGIVSIEETAKLLTNGTIWSVANMNMEIAFEIENVLNSDFYMNVTPGKPRISKKKIGSQYAPYIKSAYKSTSQTQPQAQTQSQTQSKPAPPKPKTDVDKLLDSKYINVNTHRVLVENNITSLNQIIEEIKSGHIYEIKGIAEGRVQELKKAINTASTREVFKVWKV